MINHKYWPDKWRYSNSLSIIFTLPMKINEYINEKIHCFKSKIHCPRNLTKYFCDSCCHSSPLRNIFRCGVPHKHGWPEGTLEGVRPTIHCPLGHTARRKTTLYHCSLLHLTIENVNTQKYILHVWMLAILNFISL